MKLYGVLGEKLGHSLSPAIHEQILRDIGVDGRFVIFEVAKGNLAKAVDSLKTLHIQGVSVTIPYKSSIMEYLDEVSDEARAIGAVNVIHIEEGKATGYNSDYYGFGRMLNEGGIEVAGRDVVFLGGGGAARAAIAYVLSSGAKTVRVAGRNLEKLEPLKARFPNVEISLLNQTHSIVGDILINATPLGMYPAVEHCPVAPEIIDRFFAAADLIYNPQETLFLKNAKEKGLKTVGGLSMLIYQSVYAQQVWQQRDIPDAVIPPIYNTLVQLLSHQ